MFIIIIVFHGSRDRPYIHGLNGFFGVKDAYSMAFHSKKIFETQIRQILILFLYHTVLANTFLFRYVIHLVHRLLWLLIEEGRVKPGIDNCGSRVGRASLGLAD